MSRPDKIQKKAVERHDAHVPISRSENMSRIHSTNTKPEIAVRRVAHRLGFRFRLYRKDLPGVPDLVFPRYRSVIFVHGCFWHQHDSSDCRAGRKPKSNLEYWGPKLVRNVARDAENMARLQALGWKVLVIWECQIHDTARLERSIWTFLRGSERIEELEDGNDVVQAAKKRASQM